ncbi:MAG: carboxypeptidase regulatory-like domain-containing protein, partial [Pyrinomonadaceae bacterium]|nr:carboxypeptidase regulatory-like domain-containing protein [Pyrinomonadaceae bacterium]
MKASPNLHPSRAMLLGLLLGLCGVSALAQETRSTILGTVKDTAGAVVPGATVEVTSTDTNTATRLTTNDSGYFEAPYLLPGAYSITVSAGGFKK